MKLWQPTALAQAAVLALGAVLSTGAAAQSSSDVLKELQALKARVAELEDKLKAADAKPAGSQWGMTPDQVGELNRVTVKTDAMEDARDASCLKLL